MTRRFRNLRLAKANAFKCTSSRRLLTAGYSATAATRVNFRETTIVWRCRFRLAAASPHPDEHRGRSGLQKPTGFFRPASRVACASLRRRELAPKKKPPIAWAATNIKSAVSADNLSETNSLSRTPRPSHARRERSAKVARTKIAEDHARASCNGLLALLPVFEL